MHGFGTRRESFGRGVFAEVRGIFCVGRVRQLVPVRDAEVHQFLVQPLEMSFKVVSAMVWSLTVGGESHFVVSAMTGPMYANCSTTTSLWPRFCRVALLRGRRGHFGLLRGAFHGVSGGGFIASCAIMAAALVGVMDPTSLSASSV